MDEQTEHFQRSIDEHAQSGLSVSVLLWTLHASYNGGRAYLQDKRNAHQLHAKTMLWAQEKKLAVT